MDQEKQLENSELNSDLPQNDTIPIEFDIESSKEGDSSTVSSTEFDEDSPLFEFSSVFVAEFRLIKQEIEELLLKKIKNHMFEKSEDKKKCVKYFKHFSIDRVGNAVVRGETGIAEGWNVPKYENEFQSLLGLPHTEDQAATLRIKRPKQECFNCLSIEHRIQDCPVQKDEERIKLHRSLFNTQSQQAQEQAQLFSSRYTNDLDSKENRGFIPGKISEQLRDALGLRPNQLPPFFYLVRELGYPAGWLKEAQASRAGLAVHDGDVSKLSDTGSLNGSQEDNKNIIEYDADRIYTFVGFNEAPPEGTIDESEMYRVRRYTHDLSREKFLSSLNIKKRQIVRRNLTKTDLHSDDDESGETHDQDEGENDEADKQKSAINETIEIVDSDEEKMAMSEGASPSKRMRRETTEKSLLGTSLSEIRGTPIIKNATSFDTVPNREKFSENICEHKAFEMVESGAAGGATPGNYLNIVNLTRKFKSNPNLSDS